MNETQTKRHRRLSADGASVEHRQPGHSSAVRVRFNAPSERRQSAVWASSKRRLGIFPCAL